MRPVKKVTTLKVLVIFMALFMGVSISASFVAASRHLHHIGDDHDHPLNCPLREFLDIIAISFAYGAKVLTLLIIKRIKFKKIFNSFISATFHLPLSRAPPAV